MADSGDDFLRLIKKALGRLNLLGKIDQFVEAWHRQNEAKSAMNTAREAVKEAERKLANARQTLSKLQKEYDRQCG
ncbi:protein of unknown function [Magnetospira sp. QH-2]|nr:protein of unknown function [Magnetospira sp. QH-2]